MLDGEVKFVVTRFERENYHLYFTTIVETATSPATPTSPPPLLEFSCLNGQVQNISGLSIKEKALVIDFGNGTMCHISEGTCNWENMYKKVHVIYDEKETNAKVVAGHPHYYELECKSGGYVARATAVPLLIGSTKPSYIHEELTPSNRSGIDIKIFKGGKDLSTAVEIGELLSLKINGPVNTKIFPIKCNATGMNTEYLLWENSSCSSNDKAIMRDKWTLNNETISIDMYAFRFVDSNSVTIECSAYICPSSDSACINAVNTCQKPAGRRRRSSNIDSHPVHEYKEETSSVSFTVADRFDGANGSEENGYQHLTIHVDGTVNFDRIKLEKLRDGVARLLCIPSQFVVVDGIEPGNSFLIKFTIAENYIGFVFEMEQGDADFLIAEGVDFVKVNKKVVDLKSLQREHSKEDVLAIKHEMQSFTKRIQA
ncbi:unnamed protein product [Mytilus coruscus]|uniref:ZP domain-containing protein n=1 Tax=Mytilus coruscus TaxID=42192 RepID=A0A6J8ALM6_MYTCO|nr:unnamed protein product [Mytilus coruscus]